MMSCEATALQVGDEADTAGIVIETPVVEPGKLHASLAAPRTIGTFGNRARLARIALPCRHACRHGSLARCDADRSAASHIVSRPSPSGKIRRRRKLEGAKFLDDGYAAALRRGVGPLTARAIGC